MNLLQIWACLAAILVLDINDYVNITSVVIVTDFVLDCTECGESSCEDI